MLLDISGRSKANSAEHHGPNPGPVRPPAPLGTPSAKTTGVCLSTLRLDRFMSDPTTTFPLRRARWETGKNRICVLVFPPQCHERPEKRREKPSEDELWKRRTNQRSLWRMLEQKNSRMFDQILQKSIIWTKHKPPSMQQVSESKVNPRWGSVRTSSPPRGFSWILDSAEPGSQAGVISSASPSPESDELCGEPRSLILQRPEAFTVCNPAPQTELRNQDYKWAGSGLSSDVQSLVQKTPWRNRQSFICPDSLSQFFL